MRVIGKILIFVLSSIFLLSCEKEEEETGVDPFLEEVLQLVNKTRAEGCDCGDQYFPPVNSLLWDDVLARAAQAHAQDMGLNDFFSHTGSDDSSAGDRITAQGYNWSTYGENIAAGYTSPEDVVNAWKNSTGHCENIMNDNFTEMGVGYHTEGDIWVQVFANPQ